VQANPDKKSASNRLGTRAIWSSGTSARRAGHHTLDLAGQMNICRPRLNIPGAGALMKLMASG
jgi:hypothetical protein